MFLGALEGDRDDISIGATFILTVLATFGQWGLLGAVFLQCWKKKKASADANVEKKGDKKAKPQTKEEPKKGPAKSPKNPKSKPPKKPRTSKGTTHPKKKIEEPVDPEADERPISNQLEPSDGAPNGSEKDKSEGKGPEALPPKKGDKKTPKTSQHRGKKAKQEQESEFEIVEPTQSAKKRRELELEREKRRKIKEGFYQERSDEDDTLEPVRSLKEEKSDEYSVRKSTYKAKKRQT